MLPSAEDRDALLLMPLPAAVLAILEAEDAPPRLVAHLTLVHDVAVQLLARFRSAWPTLEVDSQAVAFGAATHDIGKALVMGELSGPGKTHEAEGESLLRRHGVSSDLARFARTHGGVPDGLDLEDLLVVLADTAWKAKRVKALDEALSERIARLTGTETWDAFMVLDGILEEVAADADRRLEWQGRFAIVR